MSEKFYTSEKSQLILISLLKSYGIKRVIASPGTTNYTFVASLQHDPFFEIYSSIDERSAAYLACGMASESREPVVITCTGATASRNYMPGLTEAFYRKLPVLAVTATQRENKIGHHIAQVIDRRKQPNDLVNLSVDIPSCRDKEDEWDVTIKINTALLELTHNGGGPVHINLETNYSRDFSVIKLPTIKRISRYSINDNLPEITAKRIAVFIGAMNPWTKQEENVLDNFCRTHGVVVFCDHSSNYNGKFRIDYSLVAGQEDYKTQLNSFDLLIHIGEITGDYYTYGTVTANEVWRVNEDGKLRDPYKKLTKVFEMSPNIFFEKYTRDTTNYDEEILIPYNELYTTLYAHIPELPFSNIWVAQQLSSMIPVNSFIHFGILGSLRAWNFFKLDKTIYSSCNVGGFGIDGGLSSLIGASLVHPEQIHFGIFGDLAFFYDLNVLGNRHISKNVRILLINNGKGAEFRLYWHPVAAFKENADPYMAAAGHYGNKSTKLVKHYAEDLGFEYISATNKEEFYSVYKRFVDIRNNIKPMLFEVFTDSNDENNALYGIRHIMKDQDYGKRVIKKHLKNAIPQPVKDAIKNYIENKKR